MYVPQLTSGPSSLALSRDGKIDPRWAPDGVRVAYVTTSGSGNFHIAIAEKVAGKWTSRRWRPETMTADARYHFAQVDHELTFISNADVQNGTGRLVRQRTDLGAPPQVVRDDETSWKARPDWSPDGKRIAYSSCYGWQRRQIWLTTAGAGGYPMPLIYGDFDVTSARWSPDGTRIALVANRQVNVGIEVMETVGGARREP